MVRIVDSGFQAHQEQAGLRKAATMRPSGIVLPKKNYRLTHTRYIHAQHAIHEGIAGSLLCCP